MLYAQTRNLWHGGILGAIKTVEGIVHKEADTVSSKAGGLHLVKEEATWEFFHNFSFGNVISVVQRPLL